MYHLFVRINSRNAVTIVALKQLKNGIMSTATKTGFYGG